MKIKLSANLKVFLYVYFVRPCRKNNSYNDYKLKNCKEPISAYFINHKCMLLLFGGQKTTRIYICKLQISPLGRRRWKKIFGIVGTGFQKWFFKHLEMRNQDTIMNTHLILQKLTLDPFKTGFHFGISISKFSGSNCESNCDWFQIVICKKAKMCLKTASLIIILHGT